MHAEIERRELEATEKACLQMELAQLKKDIAAEKRQTAVQSFPPPAAATQSDMHADRVTSAAAGALQSVLEDVSTLTSSDSFAHPRRPPASTDGVTRVSAGTLTSADSQHLVEMRSAILAPTLMTSADGHTQPPPPLTVDSVNLWRIALSFFIVDRCDLPMPVYTAPSAVPAVTFTTEVEQSWMARSAAGYQSPEPDRSRTPSAEVEEILELAVCRSWFRGDSQEGTNLHGGQRHFKTKEGFRAVREHRA